MILLLQNFGMVLLFSLLCFNISVSDSCFRPFSETNGFAYWFCLHRL